MSDYTELVAEARDFAHGGYAVPPRLLHRLADALEAAEARLVEPINRQWAELFDERDEARRIAAEYRDLFDIGFPKPPLPWESPSEGGN